MCAAAPDGPKWAARGAMWRMGGKGVHVLPLQTVLNGRPGAVRGVGGAQGEEGWVKGSRIATPDGPKWTVRSGSSRRAKGQQCVVWRGEMELFCLPVPLPSDRGESGGLACEGVSLPFPLPFPFPLPRPFPFPLPLGGAPMGCGKSVS